MTGSNCPLQKVFYMPRLFPRRHRSAAGFNRRHQSRLVSGLVIAFTALLGACAEKTTLPSTQERTRAVEAAQKNSVEKMPDKLALTQAWENLASSPPTEAPKGIKK